MTYTQNKFYDHHVIQITLFERCYISNKVLAMKRIPTCLIIFEPLYDELAHKNNFINV